jgi:hypothetical protein
MELKEFYDEEERLNRKYQTLENEINVTFF